MVIYMTKDEYRKYMKKLRKDFSGEERNNSNQNIMTKLIEMQCIKDAEWLYPFVSYGTEADTLNIIRYYLEGEGKGSKRIAVPKVHGEDMDFYEIKSMDDLEPGYMGIPEPIEKNPVKALDGVMIMPGLVFDRELNRIGYGRGYYDRYLHQYGSNNLIKAAIAFDFQVLKEDKIISDSHDIKPDILITDKDIYYCS